MKKPVSCRYDVDKMRHMIDTMNLSQSDVVSAALDQLHTNILNGEWEKSSMDDSLDVFTTDINHIMGESNGSSNSNT